MEWKPVDGYEGSYEVSNTGSVRSLDRIVDMGRSGFRPIKGVNLKPAKNKCGYLFVNLKGKCIKVHRLVALNFLENKEGKREVNHIDGNKENNNVSNLEWSTRSENMKHAIKKGLIIRGGGINSNGKKLDEKKVIEIRKLYKEKSMNQVQLAEKFGVYQNTISNIVNYKTWKDVK